MRLTKAPGGFQTLTAYWRDVVETQKPELTKDGRPYRLKNDYILVRSRRAMNSKEAWYDMRDAPKIFGWETEDTKVELDCEKASQGVKEWWRKELSQGLNRVRVEA